MTTRHPIWAASILIPGAGQLAQTRVLAALLWALIVGGTYAAAWRWGILLHALCILDASAWRPTRKWLLRRIATALRTATDQADAAYRLDIIHKGLEP